MNFSCKFCAMLGKYIRTKKKHPARNVGAFPEHVSVNVTILYAYKLYNEKTSFVKDAFSQGIE